MTDSDGYPEASELDTIRQWPHTDNWFDMMEYVRSLWHWPDWGASTRTVKDEYTGAEKRQWMLHTGGWSGNESIIDAMQGNHLFWMICWMESRRGGHYIFELPLGFYDES